VAIDLGTGDGRVVLRRALREPATLAIGIDPVAAAMAEASARASRPVRKGGLENALFVVAAAESLPRELVGLAHEVTIILPWGSLLDGILAGGPGIPASIATLLRPRGRLTVLLSVVERDGHPPVDRDLIDRAFADVGLRAVGRRPAGEAELRDLGSTWAKRLRVGPPDRPVTRLSYVRGHGRRSR